MSFASMPLFTGDYLRDTRHLSPLRHGVYLLALMHCWDSKGPMPLDEQEAAGICNCRSSDEIEALRYITDRYFIRMDDGHYNKRMTEVVADAERWGQKSRTGGLHSAETRRAKARRGAARKAIEPPFNHPATTLSTVVEGSLVSPSPSPSPSLSSTPPTPRKRGECVEPEGFAQFWAAYPRRTAKASALKAFSKLAPDGALLARMLAAIREQARSDQWRRDGGAYIPHPATWLNGRRWEDEAATVAADDPFAGAA